MKFTRVLVSTGLFVVTTPATYQAETGIVKLSEAGSHPAIVRQLRAALVR